MDIASLVLGIVAIIMSFLPCCSYFTFLPAIVGLILGIVALVKKNKAGDSDKAKAIAGIVLSVLAIIIPIVTIIAFGGLALISEVASSL